MRNRERIYSAAIRAAEPLAGLLAGLHPRGRAAFTGRAASAATFHEWAATTRDTSRPLVLLHAPSVGEGLMAQAIATQLRMHVRDVQIAFSFFSPSAERVAERVGADVSGYLPFDSHPAMRRLVRDLRPDVIAFVRTEIWPVLGVEAAAAGARVALVNAALSASSSRLRGPARFLLGPAYRRLDAVGAVSRAAADRFRAFGIDHDRIFVTGDARFDQVWSRIQSLDRSDRNTRMLDAIRDDRAILVAGSTWPADEDILLAALASIPIGQRPRVVIAPHEPDESHLQQLEANLDGAAVRHARLGIIEAADAADAADDIDVIIVDRVGILADLYRAATVAYVGGGFGDDGLHSVVEPAALGVPCLFGPRHGNATEAAELADAGGGRVVYDAKSLHKDLVAFTTDATARSLAGTAAGTFVQSRLGGAASNAALIAGLIAVRT